MEYATELVVGIVADTVFYSAVLFRDGRLPLHIAQLVSSLIRIAVYHVGILLYSWMFGPSQYAQLGFSFSTGYSALIIACSIVFNIAVTIVIHPQTISKITMKNIRTSKYKRFELFSVIVFFPITEEYFFRGLVFYRWAHIVGVPLAIIIQSVWFQLNHQEFLWVRFIRSIMYALVYYLTGFSLIASILCHISNNLLALLAGDASHPTRPKSTKAETEEASHKRLHCSLCNVKFEQGTNRYNCTSCSFDVTNECESCYTLYGAHKVNHKMELLQTYYSLPPQQKAPLKDKSFGKTLENLCKAYAHRNCLRSSPDSSWISYEQFYNRLTHFALGFRSLSGILPRDRIGICSRNCVEWFIADYGLLTWGYDVVPLDVPQSPSDWEGLDSILQQTNLRAIICQAHEYEQFSQRLHSSSTLLHLILLGESFIVQPMISQKVHAFSDLEHLGAQCEKLARPVFSPEECRSIVFTSGSSGSPKGVMWSDSTLNYSLLEGMDQEALILLDFQPQSHAFSRKMVMRAVGSGGTVTIHSSE
jgi:membrane protease YdiL (CAAX protease family)